MRFLVTGGAGFLGAALSNRLVELNHEVVVLDDLSHGDKARLHPAVLFTRGTVTDVPRLWTLLQDVDCVYHLAARVSVPESIRYPSGYNTVNVGGTVSLMEAMRDVGVGRVVLASSGAVYGGQHRQPVIETDTPAPDSPYAVSKLSAEHYVNAIGTLWNIETVALRIFNAYGPHQPLPVSHAPVVPRFVRQVLGGGSLVLFGDGGQSRDFVYISDVVDALIAAATAPNVNRRVINVGSGVETSIKQLADTIEQVAGKSVNRIHNAGKAGGVPQLVADVRLAGELLEYRPKITLRNGLDMMMTADNRFKSLRMNPQASMTVR